MARSVEEIYNSIIAEKQTFTELSGLMPQYNQAPPANDNPFATYIQDVASASRVAMWRLWVYIMATALYTHEVLFDTFKAEAEAIAASSIAGNLAWYADQVKKWQYGFSLVFNNATYRYYYADTTSTAAIAARLVAKVSVREVTTSTYSGIVIKVAKDSGGTLVPLDSTPGTELTSLTTYVNYIKFAGVQTVVLSLPADTVKLNLKVYYDGTQVLTDVQTAVQDALNAYLINIEFDGVLYINKLVDALQAVPTLRTPWVLVNQVQAKASTDVGYTTVTESYEPASGYFQLASIGANPAVNTVITYEAV